MSASIWALRPLERPPETRHFTDPEQPDWPGLTLTLAPMDGPRATRFAVLKTELIRKHITGLRGPDGELVKGRDGKPVQEPEPVRCQDFSRRTPDEIVVDRYAKLAAMWAAPDGEACPPLSEMIGWQALLYAGWLEIANWIEELYTKGLEGGAAPGPPAATEATEMQGASTAPSSAPSSSATTNTPRLPPDEIPFNALLNGPSGGWLEDRAPMAPAPSTSLPSETPGLPTSGS